MPTTTPCRGCGNPTTNDGTKLCDPCWELREALRLIGRAPSDVIDRIRASEREPTKRTNRHRLVAIESASDLRRGDIVRHVSTDESFVVDECHGGLVGIKTVPVSNPAEWRRVVFEEAT